MSIKVIPFSFFGASESKLPIVASLNLTNPATTGFEVQFTIFDEGSEGPVTDFGIVYSDTDQDPVIGAPGVNQQSLGGNPPTIPGTFTGTITGLTDTTEYYVKAYAINSEGTAYTPVKEIETLWDAFTIEFLTNRIVSYSYLGQDYVKIGTAQNGMETYASYATVDLGNTTHIKLRITQPGYPGVFEHTVFDSSNSTVQIVFPNNPIWNQGGATTVVQMIAYDDNDDNFNNISFRDTRVGNSNTTSLSATVVKHWGKTKWRSWRSMFENLEGQGSSGTNISYMPIVGTPDDIPDTSELVTMALMFRGNIKAWNGQQMGTGPGLNAQTQYPSDWDVSYVKDAQNMFLGCTFLGRNANGTSVNLDWSNMSWDSCISFNSMFNTCTNAKDINMSNWSFNTDANTGISMRQMFENCFQMTHSNIFDINNFGGVNIELIRTFANNQQLTSSNTISLWGNAIGQFSPGPGTQGLATAYVETEGMFAGITNLAIDFTPWKTAGAWAQIDNAREMFSGTGFDESGTNYSTMFTNIDFTTQNTRLSLGRSWERMFISGKRIPPLTGWVFDDVRNFRLMFHGIQEDAVSHNLDLSSWANSVANNMPGPANFYNQQYFSSMFSDPGTAVVGATGMKFWNFGQVSGPVAGNNDIFMDGMFKDNPNFNSNISTWDVSKVVNMSDMFRNSNFNQDISSWSVANVTNCSGFNVGSPLSSNPAFNPNFTACTP